MESLFPDRARVPWLGRVGLFVAGMLFLLGAWVVAYFTYVQEKFVASAPQIGGALLVAMGAVAVAFHVREGRPGAAGSVPHPLVVSLLSLVAASAFMIARRVVGGWAVVLLYLLLFAAVSARVRAWSGRAGWTDRHVLALAGGALMTYAWHAFVQAPVVGGQGALDHLGDAAFALLAAAVLATAALRSAGPATSRAGFSSSGRAI